MTNHPWASFIVTKTNSGIFKADTKDLFHQPLVTSKIASYSSSLVHDQTVKNYIKLEKSLTGHVINLPCIKKWTEAQRGRVTYQKSLTWQTADFYFRHQCQFPESLLQQGGHALKILQKLLLNLSQITNYL